MTPCCSAAASPPPETPGYLRSLLAETWEAIRSGGAPAVSFHHDTDAQGHWRGKELSVCPKPGNPYAIITKAKFPDGSLVERPMPQFTRADSWGAFRKFMDAHEGKTPKIEKALANESTASAEGLMRWAGTWKEGTSYSTGQTVNHASSLWVCLKDTVDKPGTSSSWQLMVKSPR